MNRLLDQILFWPGPEIPSTVGRLALIGNRMSERVETAIDLTAELEFAAKVAREAATIVTTFYVGSSED